MDDLLGRQIHSESQWRYRAYRQGLRLVKYKMNSPAYERYGPYALADRNSNRIVRGHLRAQEVEDILFAEAREGFAPASATG